MFFVFCFLFFVFSLDLLLRKFEFPVVGALLISVLSLFVSVPVFPPLLRPNQPKINIASYAGRFLVKVLPHTGSRALVLVVTDTALCR